MQLKISPVDACFIMLYIGFVIGILFGVIIFRHPVE